MRTYLVDGSNAVRRGGFDPRFPEVESARVADFLGRIGALAAALPAVSIEVFFDGPRRATAPCAGLSVRFPVDGDADLAIVGSVRRLAASGRGAVVVTEDRGLAEEAAEEGARVIGFAEFSRRLRERKA